MRKKAKNTISIVIILLLFGSIVFTGYLSTKLSNTNNSNNIPNMSQNGSEPPEMPNGDNNMKNPPEMPNNNGGREQMGELPDNNTDNNYIYLIY